MSPEEIQALQDENARLKSEVDAKNKLIADKDAIIVKKTNDVTGARQSFAKKIAEMTAAEKDALSAKELELQQAAEDLQSGQDALKKSQEEFQATILATYRTQAIERVAGSSKELRAKVADAIKDIVGHDTAKTPEELMAVAEKAIKLVGQPSADPVRSVMNDGMIREAPVAAASGDNFADTARGKELAGALSQLTGEAIMTEAPKA